jgi:hypothetical protein
MAIHLTNNKTFTDAILIHPRTSSGSPTVTSSGLITPVSMGFNSTDSSGFVVGTIVAGSGVGIVTVRFSTPFAKRPSAVTIAPLVVELQGTNSIQVFSWSETDFVVHANIPTSAAIAGANLFSYVAL